MKIIIQLVLQIVKELSELINRESASEEKLKDTSVSDFRKSKKAIKYARIMFDGNRKFKGLDLIAKDSLEEKDYKYYLKLRKLFNKYS